MIRPMSRKSFDTWKLTSRVPYILVAMRDEFQEPVRSTESCVARLDLQFYDVRESTPLLPGPTDDAARQIAEFVAVERSYSDVVVQCEQGIGRSLAVAAALCQHAGDERWCSMVRAGTHNRTLYALACTALGLEVCAEPLVALAVRVKYPICYSAAFASCMARQRWKNWRCEFVSDGSIEFGFDIGELYDERCHLLDTKERLGRWGHPHRQEGIDAALAHDPQWVGLANDDDYYCPGYFEQMVETAEDDGADMVLCKYAAKGRGYDVVSAAPRVGVADVGNWLARAELVRQVQWTDVDFEADGRYVEALATRAKKVAYVCRPLMFKN